MVFEIFKYHPMYVCMYGNGGHQIRGTGDSKKCVGPRTSKVAAATHWWGMEPHTWVAGK